MKKRLLFTAISSLLILTACGKTEEPTADEILAETESKEVEKIDYSDMGVLNKIRKELKDFDVEKINGEQRVLMDKYKTVLADYNDSYTITFTSEDDIFRIAYKNEIFDGIFENSKLIDGGFLDGRNYEELDLDFTNKAIAETNSFFGKTSEILEYGKFHVFEESKKTKALLEYKTDEVEYRYEFYLNKSTLTLEKIILHEINNIEYSITDIEVAVRL